MAVSVSSSSAEMRSSLIAGTILSLKKIASSVTSEISLESMRAFSSSVVFAYMMLSDETNCVNCQRCVTLCPTRALKIRKNEQTFRENSNWRAQTIKEVYRQAESGGVLLSSMGNPEAFPVYWDKILVNASQVTNPSIDPLREPMFCDVKRPDGSIFELDSRALLKKAIAETAKMGLYCYFGAEYEFYLFKTDENGETTSVPMDSAGYMSGRR